MLVKRLVRSVTLVSCMGLLLACGDGAEAHKHGHNEDSERASKETANSAMHADEAGHQADHEDDHDDHDDHDEVRQSGAHLHGEAKLAIAVDGNTLVIEFESPVYNLTGFEYAPKTDEDRAVVEQVETQLSDPAQLFVMNDEARCNAVALLQPVSLELGESHDDDHHDGDGDHDHDEHDEHEGHESESDHDERHSDVLVDYRFACASPDKLQTVDVQLFEIFPRFEELDVVYLDQTRQRSATLNQSNTRLELDQ